MNVKMDPVVPLHLGDLRFPNFSDVTTKLSKHVRDQFPSGHPLLDSRVTNQVAPEAVF